MTTATRCREFGERRTCRCKGETAPRPFVAALGREVSPALAALFPTYPVVYYDYDPVTGRYTPCADQTPLT